MWASETEGAKFWMSVVTELKNRGRAFSDIVSNRQLTSSTPLGSAEALVAIFMLVPALTLQGEHAIAASFIVTPRGSFSPTMSSVGF